MSNVDKNSKVLITGGSGLVGQSLISHLQGLGYNNLFHPRSFEVDFSDIYQSEKYVSKIKPDYIFSLAALVGGIYDNKIRPADFYWINSQIGNITFHLSQKYRVKKLVCAGAGCGYPLKATEPLKEESIWNGVAQPESVAYSTAKKTLITQSTAYFKQYSLNSSVIIPSNIYGEFDNFELEKSHVIPALIHKFYKSSIEKKPVKVWGDGSAKRDFLYVKDFVAALEKSLYLDGSNVINVANGIQHSIREVCELLIEITDNAHGIEYQTDMPSGQKSREFSIDKANVLMPDWKCQYSLNEGLQKTYQWFHDNYSAKNIRT